MQAKSPPHPPLKALDKAVTLSRSESGGESAKRWRSSLAPTVSSKSLSVYPLMSAGLLKEVQL